MAKFAIGVKIWPKVILINENTKKMMRNFYT